MKVAILSINIGEYISLWKEFYESVRVRFLPEADKSFYIFTDADSFPYMDCDDVTKIQHEDMGWPFNTMKRFHLFCGIEEELKKYDMVFYLNANIICRIPFSIDILNLGKKLFFIEQAGNHDRNVEEIEWEYREESNAYIEPAKRRVYIQGGVFGGLYR